MRSLGTPSGHFSFVDVRDVAEAHVLAVERSAQGRFIVGDDVAPTYAEIVRTLGMIDSRVKPPLVVLPSFVAPLLPACDAFCHRVPGTPRIATPDVIATAVSGKVFNFSCERAKTHLGCGARIPFEQSLRDTMAEMGGRIRKV